jgi:hypothetical protein
MNGLPVRSCILLMIVSATACSAARSGPVFGDSPLTPGRYSFVGHVPVVDRYGDATRTSTEMVSGTVEIFEDGRVDLRSSHGSCDGRMRRGQATVDCSNVSARIGARTGIVRVPVREEQEIRSTRCAVFAPPQVAGRPPACLRYETEIQRVTRTKSARISVSRVG